MGGGTYSADTSKAARSLRRDAGINDFDYSARTAAAPASARKVNDDLDPKIVAGPTSPFAGKVMRESRDSDDHPESLAIVIVFDETGSMHTIPRTLVEKLPDLFPMIIRKGYVLHPHVMFAAVGDAFTDRVPIQVGQFEADNRCEEQLMKVYLEGYGGGQARESYELMMWFLANHTFTDCWDKRGQKGYVFIIGDEAPYKKVMRAQIENILGQTVEADVPTEDAVRQLQERYNVFLIRPEGTSYRPGEYMGDEIVAEWRALLGPQNVIDLANDVNGQGTPVPATDLVCETIALTIGLMEGAIDGVDDGLADLRDAGSDLKGTGLSKSLALVGAGGGGGGSLATSDAPEGLDTTSGTEKL